MFLTMPESQIVERARLLEDLQSMLHGKISEATASLVAGGDADDDFVNDLNLLNEVAEWIIQIGRSNVDNIDSTEHEDQLEHFNGLHGHFEDDEDLSQVVEICREVFEFMKSCLATAPAN